MLSGEKSWPLLQISENNRKFSATPYPQRLRAMSQTISAVSFRSAASVAAVWLDESKLEVPPC
jgi:hypothetical protein